MSERPSALRSTVVVSATRAAAAALTLTQGILSAHLFGTSYQKDAFLVAQTIPSMIATFLVGGIYWTLFASLGAVDRRAGAHGMRRYLARVLLTLGLALAPLVLAIEVFPSSVVRLMAPGFADAPAALASQLLRLTVLAAVAGMVFSATSALFHSRGLFAGPAMANLLPGGVTLILLGCCADRFGIQALAIGPLAGTLLELSVLASLLYYRFPDPAGFARQPHDAGEMRGLVRGFWVAFLPMSLGANFAAINIAVDNAFASYLPIGSITMLGFAFVIVSNAQLLTTSTVAEVLFPRLNQSIAERSADTQSVFRSQWRHMLLVTAPIGAGAFAFAPQIVRALFERGAFTPEATAGVAALLRAYSPGIIGLGFLTLFSLFLTAEKRFALIAATAGFMIGVNALLDFLLIRRYGMLGIALGTSLTVLLHATLLGSRVRSRLGRLTAAGDRFFVLKVAVAAAVMGAAVSGLGVGWERLAGIETTALRLAEALGGLLFGAAVYAGLVIFFQVSEARNLIRRLAGRILPPRLRPRS